jgi:hypothetical protein
VTNPGSAVSATKGGAGGQVRPRQGEHHPVAIVVCLLTLTVASRLALLATPLAAVNGDEAAAALMARRILHGHGYFFFAGQDYMGAFEQYLQAAALAGAPTSSLALRAPDLILTGLAGWLLFSVARRLFDPGASYVALALFAIWPLFGMIYGFRASGAYNAALALGLLTVLRAVAEPRRLDVFLIGLAAGIGFWLTPASALLTGPAVIAVLARTHRPLRFVHVAMGVLVGMTPICVWSIINGRIGSFGSLSGAPEGSNPFSRAEGLLTRTLPMILGLAWKDGRPLAGRSLTAFVIIAIIAVYVFACQRHRHSLADLLTLRGLTNPSDVILVALFFGAAVYVASSYTWWTTEPRYLHLYSPWLILFLAGVCASSPRFKGASAVTLATCLALTLLGVRAAIDEGWATRPSDLATAAAFLRENGYAEGYGDYRPAFPLTVSSDESVAIVPSDGQACRFPDLVDRVGAEPRRVWVLSAVHRAELEPRLRDLGVDKRLDLPTLSVYITRLPATTAQVSWLDEGCPRR